MVYTIAKDTGWPEEHIIWGLPLVRALQYYHCALQAANLWTLEVNTHDSVSAMVPDDLLARIDAMVDAAGYDDE